MKCIVVDDEPLAREGMRLNIQEVFGLELVGMFDNAIQANEFIQKNDIDLIFLDIQMPEMTGFEFLKILKNPPLVIITTAYPQFALDSYDFDVIDYLVKPIRVERFVRAVNRAEDFYTLKNAGIGLLDSISDDYMFIKADRKYIKISFNETVYIEGLKDYVVIYTLREKFMTAMNVKTIFNQLPQETFARINKSYVINVNHIKAIDNDFVLIKGHELPIGRTFKEDFVNNYINKKLFKR